MSPRGFLLVVLPLLCLSVAACRDRRMDARDLTTLTVVRHLPAPLPADSTSLAGVAADSVDSPAADAPAAPGSTPASPGELRPPKGEYHVIAASFPDSLSAVARLRVYQGKGFPDACILHANARYRVSIARYATRQAAIDARARLVKTLDQPDLWIARH